MRGTKAKAIRHAVYGATRDFRVRTYLDVNKRRFYRVGEARKLWGLRSAWGAWFQSCTKRADSFRWAYQRMKRGLLQSKPLPRS